MHKERREREKILTEYKKMAEEKRTQAERAERRVLETHAAGKKIRGNTPGWSKTRGYNLRIKVAHDDFHLEGQGQQTYGNITTSKFSSKPLNILIWKYVAVPSVALGQNPGIPSLMALWVNLQLVDCSGSRRQLTTTFSRAMRAGAHSEELHFERPATQETGAEERAINIFEDILWIKTVTGVSDVQDVVKRFVMQEETLKHLEELELENEKQMVRLRGEKEVLHAEYDQLKYSGETKLS
eukprot:g32038.t1